MGDAEVRAVVAHEADVPVEGGAGGAFGSVTWRTLLSADRTPTDALTVGIAEVLPGDGTPVRLHRHAQAEAYYVIAGEGIMAIEGDETPLRAGSVVFIPGGRWHAARATGTEVLRLLYAFATDSFADVVYEFDGESA